MPQVAAAVLRSEPSSTSASASIRRAAAPSFSPHAALRSSKAVRSRRVIDTAAPIEVAPLARASIESEFHRFGNPKMSQPSRPLVLFDDAELYDPAQQSFAAVPPQHGQFGSFCQTTTP